MGSGRFVTYLPNTVEQQQQQQRFFQPPRAVAHTAALASCYSRFRHAAEWIGHVDDDEFLVRPPSPARPHLPFCMPAVGL